MPQLPALAQRLPPRWHEDVVRPDGIPVMVEWDVLEVGTSVFIPALNHTRLKAQIEAVAARKGMKLYGVPRIEGKKYGMRFWRMA